MHEAGGTSPADAPLLGKRVVLGGLSSRPELNGQRGLARSFEGGRYAVALEGGGESVRVRPGNMSPAVSSSGVAVSDEVVAAAERGEEEAVLAWLEGGGRANVTFERGGVSGATLLMGAAVYGHERVVELLLRHGAKANQQSSDGRTALFLAAQEGHERLVDLLIRHGAEVNLQDSRGGTALMTAAFFGHPAVVRRLLRAGADAAARTANGSTAPQLAKEKSRAECVEAFKKHFQEVAAGRPAATAVGGRGAGGASSGGASSAGSRVAETPSPAAAAGRAPSDGVAAPDAIVVAAERGEEEAVLAWLDGGGRADATYERGDGVSGITLLMGAARYGHERVVELLLRHGAEVNLQNSFGGTALMRGGEETGELRRPRRPEPLRTEACTRPASSSNQVLRCAFLTLRCAFVTLRCAVLTLWRAVLTLLNNGVAHRAQSSC